MAKSFPASTTIALQQATATVTGKTRQQTVAEARRVKQRKSTTQGRSRKSISVYSVPPFPWKEDKIFGQINGHLGNAKRSIHITSVKSGWGGLSFLTTDVPNDEDIDVFDRMFRSILANIAPLTDLKVEVPTSKSSVKINDFPFFGLAPTRNDKGQLVALTEEQLVGILAKAPFAKDFAFYENSKPRLIRNSARSDSGMLWFDIEDSRAGLQL